MMRFGKSVERSSMALVQSYRCLRIALYVLNIMSSLPLIRYWVIRNVGDKIR